MNEQQSDLLENLRRLPRGAWILFLGTFLNKFGTFVLPFLALYLTHLGFASRQAGVAIGAYGVGTIAACLAGGYLADRIGRRRTIALSMALAAAAMLCLSPVRDYAAILLFAGVTGFACELYRPASSALLTDLVPSELRVTAFAAYRVSLNAGFTFGPAVAGLLVENSFLWLFVGDAITSVLFGLVAWVALPSEEIRTDGATTSLWRGLRLLRGDLPFVKVLTSSLVIGLVFVQIFSTMSLEIVQSGLSPRIYGFLISLNGFLIILFELPMTSFTKRFSAARVMSVGYLLIGLGFASNLLPRTVPLFVLTTVVFTLGEMIALPVSAAFVAAQAPSDRRGFYMGMYGLTWALSFVLGPSLGMALFAVNSASLWTACGLFGLLAAWIISPSSRIGAATPCPAASTG